MAFIENALQKASETALLAGKKANEAYSSAKIKMEIAEKKNCLKNLYRELGEITYKGYKNADGDVNEIEDKIAEIDIVSEQIAELEKECGKMKNLIVCPSCNEKIDEKSRFCPNCGEEIL